jgi:hypothetical protein
VRCLHQDLGVVARQALDLAVELDGERALALVSDIEADMPNSSALSAASYAPRKAPAATSTVAFSQLPSE